MNVIESCSFWAAKFNKNKLDWKTQNTIKCKFKVCKSIGDFKMVFQYSLNQIYQPESLTFNALLAMYFSRSSHLPDLPALLTFLFYSFRPSPLPFLTQLSFEAFIKSPFSFHTPCEQVCDCSVKSLRGKGPTEQKALPNRWRYCLRGQMVAFWPLWRNRCRRANGVQMN